MSSRIAVGGGGDMQQDGDRLDSSVAVEIDDLVVAIDRGGAEVLSGISLGIRKGRILGVVGESGSGKSTLGLSMLGYLRQGLSWLGGDVRVEGVDLGAVSPARRASMRGSVISYVPQDPAVALNPALRISTQLEEMVRHHGVAGDPSASPTVAVLEACRAAGLSEPETLLSRYPHQLSGGQNQRIGIAMALVCRPAVIVLDEPTTGLDVTTQRRLLMTVRSLARERAAALVYISHDIAVISEIADDVAVMYAGRIVETGRNPDVFQRPCHPYTRALIGAVPKLRDTRRLTGIAGQPPEPANRPSGCVFAPRCAFADAVCEISEPELRASARHSGSVRCVFDDFDKGVGKARDIVPEDRPRLENIDAMPVLNVMNLSTEFQGVRVLHGVTLEMRRGECLGIVGESGSGKTTLAQSISGLVSSWTGDVLLNGELLATVARRRSAEQLRRMQYVFQNPYSALNPDLSVRQILERPLRRFKLARRDEIANRIERALADVSIPLSFSRKRVGQMSGGERQRIAIARALVVEPDVLLCDEVTSALDVSIQASVIELLKELQDKRDMTLLFITHNLALISGFAQRIAIMSRGNIVDFGTAEEVFNRPRAEYTRELMRNIPQPAF